MTDLDTKAAIPSQGKALSWYLLAWRERGDKHYEGLRQHPHVVGYLRSLSKLGTIDEIAWQSAFVNHCLTASGYLGTNDARAGSWATWGTKSVTPVAGSIVVISEQFGTKVGYYVREDEHSVWVLGANKDTAVCIRSYPKTRVVSCRMPSILNASDHLIYQQLRAS